MKKLLVCVVLAILGCAGYVDELPCLSCGGSSIGSCPVSSVSNNSVTCDGQTYRTVRIGNQTWFAENLNYNVSGSKCYDNSSANCNKYGRLYNWSTAKAVCPSGWHLPSQAEWNTLSGYVESNSGCSRCDAKKLKATSGWNSNGNGTGDYSFSALPGGGGGSDGSFNNVGSSGYWWSASESEDNGYGAYLRDMPYDGAHANWHYGNKGYLFAVRCLQD
jgi:uncharacterized protein (TIGR02145 family)